MDYKKNFYMGIILTSLLTSCASAPKPPECNGEFKPVNPLEQNKKSSLKSGNLMSCNGRALHG